jgi:hypothetical protein
MQRQRWEYAVLGRQSVPTKEGRQVWENTLYWSGEERVLNDWLPAALNDLGAEGWELVTSHFGYLAYRHSRLEGAAGGDQRATYYEFFFKRQL